MFLRQRLRSPEIMDQPDLDPRQHVAALGGLARINFWSHSAGILWPPLKALARQLGRPLRVLDVGSGAGDVSIRLERRARRAGIDLDLEGCDISPVAVEYARDCATRAGTDIRFFQLDALRDDLPEGYDVLMASLFLHHLSEDEARGVLRRMAGAARHLVLINDLVRSWLGLGLAHLATHLFTASDVVHNDGPRSVEGAFTIAEVRTLAGQAGMHGAVLRRRWPFRYLLTWSRP
jgi:SAM-dependent methyltransferase